MKNIGRRAASLVLTVVMTASMCYTDVQASSVHSGQYEAETAEDAAQEVTGKIEEKPAADQGIPDQETEALDEEKTADADQEKGLENPADKAAENQASSEAEGKSDENPAPSEAEGKPDENQESTEEGRSGQEDSEISNQKLNGNEAEENENISSNRPEENKDPNEAQKEIGSGTEPENAKADKNLFQEENQVQNKDAETGKGEINYVYVENGYIKTPQVQNVLIGVGTKDNIISEAILNYHNTETGERLQQSVSRISDDSLLFSIPYESEDQTGIYQLDSVSYVVNGQNYLAAMEENDVNALYGVNREAESKPDAIITDNELQMEVVTYDENGNQVSETSIQDALGNAEAVLEQTGKAVSRTGGNIVLVLDPGHGGSDPGACRTFNGVDYYERDINLKITQFCKEELETYAGVTVYMTRTDNTSPLMNRLERCTYAQSVGATAVISFHINSTGEEVTTASGSLVYSPNTDTASGAVSQELAAKILEKLEALGLKNNGIVVDESLGMVLYPKNMGFPGILIEHAFVNNPNDVAAHFSSDAALKQLGVADATGLAEYYGLRKQTAAPSKPSITKVWSRNSTQMTIEWNPVSGVAGYQVFRSTSQNGTYSRIATVTSGGTTRYVDSNLQSGVTYYYKVRAYSKAGGSTAYSLRSGAKSGMTLSPGTMVKTQAVQAGEIKLTWNEVGGADGYQIERSTSRNGTYTRIVTLRSGSTTSYTDEKVKTNTVYYYRVRAFNKENGGYGYGSYGSPLSAKSVAKTQISGIQSYSGGRLKISWKRVSGANSYAIYRSTSKNGKYTKAATVKPGSKTSYIDKDIQIGRYYYYKIQVQNSVNKVAGYSGYCTALKGKAVGRTSITGVQSISDTKLKITWKEVAGCTGYELTRSTSKNGAYVKVAAVKSGHTTSYTNSRLTPGKTYYYKVRALNRIGGKTGYSSYSAPVYGKPVAKTSVSYVQAVSGGRLKVVWKKNSRANGYQIQRSTSKYGKYTTVATISGGSATSYTDKEVKTNKKYYYRIQSLNRINGTRGYSGYSAAVYGKALQKPVITYAKTKNSQAVQLKWSKAGGANGYRVSRSKTQKSGYKIIASTDSNSEVTYQDTDVDANTTYYYRVEARNRINGRSGGSGYSSPYSVTLLGKVKRPALQSTADGKINVTWKKINGATGYQVYRSTKKNGTYARIAMFSGNGSTTYKDSSVKAGGSYYYKVRAYQRTPAGISFGGYSDAAGQESGYEIMGSSSVTLKQMTAYFKANASYPSYYAATDAPDLNTFCQIYLEECKTEGIRAEVAFCQAMKETGFLKFGGDVEISQLNFAGLGAVGGGVKGDSFTSVRNGVRAQVQHLKAYASTAPLVNKRVDSRFLYVTRGCAPYVEWLGIPDNPSEKGWASAAGYGYSLRDGYIAKLLSY